MKTAKRLLIVIPCYNEEDSLPHLLAALEATAKSIDEYILDIVFIDDGSTDGTNKLIKKLSSKHENVYYREFSKNSGHQSALRAGLEAAIGYDAAIMMDADMQHPPKLIPDMIAKWQAGAKIVQMIRTDSPKEVGLFKYATSKGYYAFINSISSLNLEYGASDFRLIDKLVIKAVATSKENDLFLRGYFSWLPVPQGTVVYSPGKRIAGESKYSLGKMLSLAYQGVLQFSERPLMIAVFVGALLSVLSFLYGVVLIVQYCLGERTVSGWTSLMVTSLFCFGINFVLIGIIGAYLAHSIRLSKQRPEFIITDEKIPDSE